MEVKEFTKSMIPLDEIVQFYCTDDLKVPADRPYTWSNTLRTYDGVIAFQDQDTVIGDIGLASVPQVSEQYQADFRLLIGSWMFSDAIIVGSKSVIDEPQMPCTILFPDLQDYRVNVLKKDPNPTMVVLSRHLLPIESPIFHKDLRVLIYTTIELKPEMERLLETKHSSNVSLIAMPDRDFDLAPLLRDLRSRGIQFLDVSVGGVLINEFLNLKLLDEMRNTMAGQIVGPLAENGQTRPSLFPSSRPSYSKHTAPLIAWHKMRYLGTHFVFFRGFVQYRHGLAKTEAADSNNTQ
ncbi:dihydrofolate reductase-like domain-containing protein [Gorgonomyces haynaldii]|nr:dihydrofolate reductase-like domain-containing protein [Gorgonomyces haynaldii]